jgi:hypothetical protein
MGAAIPWTFVLIHRTPPSIPDSRPEAAFTFRRATGME